VIARQRAIIAVMIIVAGVLTIALAVACLAPARVSVDLASADMKPDGGFAYIAPILLQPRPGFEIVSDNNSNSGSRSNIQLRENGRLLGPAHSLHAEIRERGQGRYSLSQQWLRFSASDSSDPRSNGRAYSVSASTSVHPYVLLAVALFDLSGIWMCRRYLRRRYPSGPAEAGPRWTGPGAAPIAARIGTALLTVAAALALAWFAQLEYKTNDDVGMRFIAEAIIGDPEQSQFLLFQNVVVGLFLHGLYSMAPTLPWYDLVLATGTVSGALLCEVALLRLCRSRREIVFCVALGLAFFTPIFHAYQFTAAAMLLGAGALLTLVSLVCFPAKTRPGLCAASAVILLAFVAGSLVRFNAAFLSLVLVLPVVMLFSLIRRRQVPWIPIAALACGIAGSLLLQAYDNRYYATASGWENVRGHGHQLARAAEYAVADRSQAERWDAALSAAQWTENDYRLVSGWLFQNREIFSTERIKRFADTAPSQPIANRLELLNRMLLAPENSVWIVPFFCLAALLLRGSLQGLAGVLLSMLSAMIAVAAIAMVFKIGFQHILWPFYTVVVLAGAAAVLGQRPRNRPRGGYLAAENRVAGAVALLGVAGLTLLQIGEVFARGARSDELRRRVDHDVAIWPVRPDSTVVVWNHNFPYETWVRPFRPAAPMFRRFLHLNTPSITPLLNSFYEELGTSDVAWSMCHVPGVLRVDARLGYAGPHRQMLMTYMLEHHHEDVEVAPVFAGEAVSLYTCRVAPAQSGRQQ
jgi:hypothetical protein